MFVKQEHFFTHFQKELYFISQLEMEPGVSGQHGVNAAKSVLVEFRIGLEIAPVEVDIVVIAMATLRKSNIVIWNHVQVRKFLFNPYALR